MSTLYIEGEPTGKWLDSENVAQWARELLARNADLTSDEYLDDLQEVCRAVNTYGGIKQVLHAILVEAFRHRSAAILSARRAS
jgi:hypothetical protein